MNLLAGLNQYWALITFMGGVIFQMVWTYFKVIEHSTKINILEKDGKTASTTVEQIKNQISSIDAKLDILLTGYHKNK